MQIGIKKPSYFQTRCTFYGKSFITNTITNFKDYVGQHFSKDKCVNQNWYTTTTYFIFV